MKTLTVSYSALTDILEHAASSRAKVPNGDSTSDPVAYGDYTALVRAVAIMVCGSYRCDEYKRTFHQVLNDIDAGWPASWIAANLLDAHGTGE